MADQTFRFDDGAGYELMMGKWSQLAGEVFLGWLAPRPSLRWLDVGCGNGVITEMVVERFSPIAVQGIDPAEGQLAYARTRPAARLAEFRQGDAMALPFFDNAFDMAIMALVIFFVPDPRKGVAEMVRVVSPGGTVAAYAWDLLGGGFPLHAIQVEMRALGITPSIPPSPEACRLDIMRELWTSVGLDRVETMEIEVEREFADFEDFWKTSMTQTNVGRKVAAMASSDVEILKERVRSQLPADAQGRVTCNARANAVKGRVRR